jgi:outer membrane lipoprotein carrier protein
MAACAHSAWANGLESLENFVKTVKQRPRRVQPGRHRAGQRRAGRAQQDFHRHLRLFERPNRFRFIYRKPFEQSIVADGQTCGFTTDLNQVTSRKQSSVLGSTPAALIAAAPDLRAAAGRFHLAARPTAGGLQWVVATPKSKDGQLPA